LHGVVPTRVYADGGESPTAGHHRAATIPQGGKLGNFFSSVLQVGPMAREVTVNIMVRLPPPMAAEVFRQAERVRRKPGTYLRLMVEREVRRRQQQRRRARTDGQTAEAA
jgi:hypothetical protein